MGKDLLIRNLASTVDSERLEAMFAPFGTVKTARVVVDQYSGKSRGFGFIKMSSESEANACIEHMNSREHEGKVLTVAESKQPSRKSKR